MRVRVPSAPWVAQSSDFGAAELFVAGGREVTSSTLRHDLVSGYAEVGQKVVWLAVPVASDVLLGAWMIGGLGSVSLAELNAMSDDVLRECAICMLLMAGTEAAQAEIRSEAFASRYLSEGAELAEYAHTVSTRLSRVFGL
jgi:hypothetical protein